MITHLSGPVNFFKRSRYQGDKINPPLKVRADQISDSGFYFFQKSHFRGFIFSRNLSNLSIFFRKSHQFCGTFWTLFWTSFLSFFPCKTSKTPQKNSARFARRVHFFQQSQIRVLFFPEISAISDSGFYFFQKSHQCFKSGFCLGGGLFLSPWYREDKNKTPPLSKTRI